MDLSERDSSICAYMICISYPGVDICQFCLMLWWNAMSSQLSLIKFHIAALSAETYGICLYPILHLTEYESILDTYVSLRSCYLFSVICHLLSALVSAPVISVSSEICRKSTPPCI